MADISFDSTEKFQEAVATARAGAAELALIERAVGRAVIQKLQGNNQQTLTAAYKDLGGVDPASAAMFEGLDPSFSRLNLEAPRLDASRAAKVAKDGGIKNRTVRDANPAFVIPGTALNTLAQLGGPEFRDSLHIKL